MEYLVLKMCAVTRQTYQDGRKGKKKELLGKMQFLAYNSKTKAFRANLTWGKFGLSGQDLSALKFSGESDHPLLGCCPGIGNFKEMLPFLGYYLEYYYR